MLTVGMIKPIIDTYQATLTNQKANIMKIDGRKNTDRTNLNNNNTLEYTKYCGTYTVVVKNEDRLTVAIIAERVSKEEAQNIINEYLVSDKEVLEVEDKAITINEALQIKPVFILSVNYDAGSLGEMVGEDRDLNLYLAEMTIQHYSLLDDACLAFTVECLVSVNDSVVTIDEMNTCPDSQTIYANNIAELSSFDSNTIRVWQDSMTDDEHNFLIDLIENQPIYDIPTHYTIEAY